MRFPVCDAYVVAKFSTATFTQDRIYNHVTDVKNFAIIYVQYFVAFVSHCAGSQVHVVFVQLVFFENVDRRSTIPISEQ